MTCFVEDVEIQSKAKLAYGKTNFWSVVALIKQKLVGLGMSLKVVATSQSTGIP